MAKKEEKNEQKIQKSLKERIDYNKDFLERHKSSEEILPFVQKDLERSEWAYAALSDSNRPDKLDAKLPSNFSDNLDQENKHWMDALPLTPKYDISLIQTSASIASGTATTYDNVVAANELKTPGAINYADIQTNKFQKLQAAHNRPQEICDLVAKLNDAETLVRFDKAYKAFIAVKTGTGDSAAAASAIRNLLSGIRGVLKQKALEVSKRPQVKDRPKEIFELVASHLIKPGLGIFGQKQLIKQATTSKSLYDKLSDPTKEKEKLSPKSIENVWALMLEHIATVLGLVDLDRFGSEK